MTAAEVPALIRVARGVFHRESTTTGLEAASACTAINNHAWVAAGSPAAPRGKG